MKKLMFGVVAAAFAVTLASGLRADEKTIKGELIDIQCHTKQGEKGTGEDHANCAMACARRGAALGILAADGVYAVAGDFTKDNNKKLLDFVARRVEARGTVTEENGAKRIDVTAISLDQ